MYFISYQIETSGVSADWRAGFTPANLLRPRVPSTRASLGGPATVMTSRPCAARREIQPMCAHRAAPFVLNINSRWALPGDPGPHVAWTRKLWEAMQPFSAGGAYVNFLGDEGSDRVRAAYGEPTYRRLVSLKKAYDPDNAFRLNQNIAPEA
jgi:Berberine and berberine like